MENAHEGMHHIIIISCCEKLAYTKDFLITGWFVDINAASDSSNSNSKVGKANHTFCTWRFVFSL